MKLLYIDLFCGAGGTSTGVEKARLENEQCAKVIACVNHDKNAIASHAANHPDALHFIEDIRTLNLSPLVSHLQKCRAEYPEALIVLWASLEWKLQLCPPSLEAIDNNDFPAWSLVRLLELLPYEIPCDRSNVLHHPELIKYETGYNFSVCRYTVDCFAGTHIENSPFDSCVSMIKWLIAKGYFSKEYLSNTD